MTIKFSKSLFYKNSVPFLGYTMMLISLQIDEDRIKLILNFPTTKTRKQLKSFLGCINCSNKFLNRFLENVQPPLWLTSRKVKFNWTLSDDQIFLNINKFSSTLKFYTFLTRNSLSSYKLMLQILP